MCTVVYLPTENGICLASLRDESPKRKNANVPAIIESNNIYYLSPTDPAAGGTWIGVNQPGSIIVLLNGGFENHTKTKVYKKSRGLIVSELLAKDMPVKEWTVMDMEGIEPYTLIIFTEGKLFQLVWDGQHKHQTLQTNKRPQIWSSATLYDDSAKAMRNQHFENWIAANPPLTKLSLFNFFKSTDDKENGFIINRNELVKTMSYSFIEMQQDALASFSYYDFSSQKYHTSKIELLQNTRTNFMVAI